MSLKLVSILSLILYGCSIGGQGVFYDEMVIKPSIFIAGDSLTVQITQPTRHSALILYRIDISVDHAKKIVFISAEQGIGREYQGALVVNLKDYNINDSSEYSFFWIDPPIKKTTKLELVKTVN
jgi:hypothetical protein